MNLSSRGRGAAAVLGGRAGPCSLPAKPCCEGARRGAASARGRTGLGPRQQVPACERRWSVQFPTQAEACPGARTSHARLLHSLGEHRPSCGDLLSLRPHNGVPPRDAPVPCPPDRPIPCKHPNRLILQSYGGPHQTGGPGKGSMLHSPPPRVHWDRPTRCCVTHSPQQGTCVLCKPAPGGRCTLRSPRREAGAAKEHRAHGRSTERARPRS